MPLPFDQINDLQIILNVADYKATFNERVWKLIELYDLHCQLCDPCYGNHIKPPENMASFANLSRLISREHGLPDTVRITIDSSQFNFLLTLDEEIKFVLERVDRLKERPGPRSKGRST